MMSSPVFLLILSLVGLAAALAIEGLFDLVLIAGPCTLASLILLLRALGKKTKSAEASSQTFVIIDGSNAMHWKDGTPQVDTLLDVLECLSGLGFTPGVVFDANAGYLLTGKHQNASAMGKLLDLPKDRVMVVPSGTPADPTILEAARHLDARVVTNDHFKDWAESFPEVLEQGFLIKGGFKSGALWLDVDEVAT